jgi:FkbH-like protein
LENLKTLLEGMAENPNRSLGQLPILYEAERKTDLKGLTPQKEPDITHVPPDNKLQQSIAAIWQEVLVVPRIGMNDNFFELGGNSMQIMRVYYRLREMVRGEFNITDVFRFPTINALTVFLNQRSGNNNQNLIQKSNDRATARRATIMHRQQIKRGVPQPEPSPVLPPASDNLENIDQPSATIVVSSTFTAEPVAETLDFWGQKLRHPFKVEFAPYDQVFQQLLGSSTLFSKNSSGMNVILIRFDDWTRNDKTSKPDEKLGKIRENVNNLILALKSASKQSAAPYLVCVCPASPAVSDANQKAFFRQMEDLILFELAATGNVYPVKSAELTEIYQVAAYYDAFSDELGHIPYTPAYFTALGTMITRKFHAIYSAPYKVIVLDCDQTIWKGVCGEDGPLGIEIDPPRKMLQEFMVEQCKAGMLICLCSKNNEEDVNAVFKQHPEMPLKREHITSSMINWRSKSENLKALAGSLELGLDSFIFIDDNPVECNEVQTFCPEVLTLCLPEEPDKIPGFLQHVWAFDHLKITDEDKKRTVLYQENAQRKSFQEQSLNLTDFITGLGLKVQISAAMPHHLPRVAQLTQRTNQFNLTTIRRSEAEIQELCQSKALECLITEVSDRFGDYGMVGVILFKNHTDAVKVDTFLLSCRAMGKGVEHKMLARLGEIAKERGLGNVEVPYIPTNKNQPALDFLNGVSSEYKQPLESGFICRFPAGYARTIAYVPGSEKTSDSGEPGNGKLSAPPILEKQDVKLNVKSELFHDIAAHLNGAEKILKIIESWSHKQRPELPSRYLAPGNEIERSLTNIWQKVLGIDQVGIHDNFFDIGGTSVKGVQLMAYLNRDFKVNIPIVTLFEKPTISSMAALLANGAGNRIIDNTNLPSQRRV